MRTIRWNRAAAAVLLVPLCIAAAGCEQEREVFKIEAEGDRGGLNIEGTETSDGMRIDIERERD